jgi:hypothetical protein
MIPKEVWGTLRPNAVKQVSLVLKWIVILQQAGITCSVYMTDPRTLNIL